MPAIASLVLYVCWKIPLGVLALICFKIIFAPKQSYYFANFIVVCLVFPKGIIMLRKSQCSNSPFLRNIHLDLALLMVKKTTIQLQIITTCLQFSDQTLLERCPQLLSPWQEGQRLEVFMKIYKRFVSVKLSSLSTAVFFLVKWLRSARATAEQEKKIKLSLYLSPTPLRSHLLNPPWLYFACTEIEGLRAD